LPGPTTQLLTVDSLCPQFDLIYLGDSFSNRPDSVHALKNTLAAAVTGRIVLSSMHYEHCGQTGTANECPPLYLALE